MKGSTEVPEGVYSCKIGHFTIVAHDPSSALMVKLFRKLSTYRTLFSFFKLACRLSKEEFFRRSLRTVERLFCADEVFFIDTHTSFSSRGESLSLDEIKRKYPKIHIRELKNRLYLVVARERELDEEEDLFCRKFLELVESLNERWHFKEDIHRMKEALKEHSRLVEIQKEHIKRMRIIYYVSQAMRSVYDPNNLYRVILLSLVSERAFNFDRAVLLKKKRCYELPGGRLCLGWGNKAGTRRTEALPQKKDPQVHRSCSVSQGRGSHIFFRNEFQ